MAKAITTTRPSGRRERRKQEVHERLLAAAVELFEKKGISSTTVEEIADAADFAEKTFYNHFPTKQQLIRELAESLVEEHYTLLEEARKHSISTRERIAFFAERSADLADQRSTIRRELILEIIRVSQIEGSGPVRRHELRHAWAALLNDGIARGDVGDRFSIEFLAEMAVGSFGAVCANWASQAEYPLRERMAECALFLGDAVSATRSIAAADGET